MQINRVPWIVAIIALCAIPTFAGDGLSCDAELYVFSPTGEPRSTANSTSLQDGQKKSRKADDTKKSEPGDNAGARPFEPDGLPEGPPIVNPYYSNVQWRVWRDDATPVKDVRTLVRDG